MGTSIEIGLFALGFVLAVWWFSVVILPLVYGFPRAVWWCIRGRAWWRAPFTYVISPIVWTAVFLGAGVVLAAFFRPALDHLLSSGGFAFGQTAGLVVAVARATMSKSAHRDMDADFVSFMRPYLKADASPNGGWVNH